MGQLLIFASFILTTFIFSTANSLAFPNYEIGPSTPIVQQEVRLTLNKTHCQNSPINEGHELERVTVLYCHVTLDRDFKVPVGGRFEPLFNKGSFELLPNGVEARVKQDTNYGSIYFYRIRMSVSAYAKEADLLRSLQNGELYIRFLYWGTEIK